MHTVGRKVHVRLPGDLANTGGGLQGSVELHRNRPPAVASFSVVGARWFSSSVSVLTLPLQILLRYVHHRPQLLR